jgi:tetratricopeptide (TPR) repeat protein
MPEAALLDRPPLPARYQLFELVGRGAMGVVYRAWDQIAGREVAVKAIAPPQGAAPVLDDLERCRFERECRTLSRLHHPAVVQLFDSGRCRSGAYYTMELLRGLPLSAWLSGPAPDAAGIRWRLHALFQALDGLEHIHAAGYLHRDLKPANLVILPSRPDGGEPPRSGGASAPWSLPDAAALLEDPDPHAKWVDFGLALHRDDVRGLETAAPGSAPFLAPERADPGAAHDPRSDIYSFGVLLYQAVTHRLPFGSVAAALSRQRRDPGAPEDLNPACTRELGECIRRQLSRDPRRRCQSAGELRQALKAASGMREAAPIRLAAPAFLGREREIRSIEEALRGLAGGGGACILVSGPRGAGKSWLFERSGLKTRAAIDFGAACASCSWSPARRRAGGLRPAIAEALMLVAVERGPDALAEALGPRGGALAAELALDELGDERWRETLGAASAAARPGGGGDEDDGPCQERRIEAVLDVLAAAAMVRPLALFIEDLHEAEEFELRVLERLIARLDRLPILIAAAFRSAGAGRRPALERWLDAVGAGDASRSRCSRLRLGPFRDDEVAEFVRACLGGADAPAELLPLVLTSTRGLPGRLGEALRELWSRGRLVHDGRRWLLRAPEAAAPPAANGRGGAAAQALDPRRLDAAQQEILAAAAVIGDHFEPAALESLLPEEQRDGAAPLARELRHLSEQGFLESTPDGFRFSGTSLRRQAARLGPPERRRELHRRFAEALLERQREEGDEVWFQAARHFERACDPARSRDCYLRFARGAAARGAYHRSLASYRRALDLLEAPEERSVVLEEEARLLSRLGDFDGALARLREAAACRRPGAELLPLLEEEGRIHQRRGDPEPALSLFERCLELAAPGDRARIRYRIGSIRFDQGDAGEAERLFEECLSEYERGGDDGGMAMAQLGLGLVAKRQGRIASAIGRIEDAIHCAERAGQPGQVAAALQNLANLHRQSGDDGKAIECFDRALKIRRELGDRPGIAICLINLSRALGHRGDVKAAVEAAAEALRTFEEVGDKKGLLIGAGNLGSFLYYRGELGAARRIFVENLERARRLRHGRGLADALHSLGRLENAVLEPGAAAIHLGEGLDLLQRSADAEIRALTFGELALSRLGLGDAADARKALEQAWESCRDARGPELAGKLHDVASIVSLAEDDVERALDASLRAVEMLDGPGWRFDAAAAHRQLGRVFRQAGPDWVDKAERHFGSARAAFEALENRFELAKTHLEEAELWMLLEEPGEAEPLLCRARETFAACGAEALEAAALKAIERLEGER